MEKSVICVRCKEDKPVSEFHNCSRKKSGKQSYCRTCAKISRKGHDSQKYKYNYDKLKAQDPEKLRWHQAKGVYKRLGISITKEQYDILYLSQDCRCAICKRHQSEFKQKLHLDHCHKTGKVRGFLCSNCNTALGLLKDNTLLLLEAVKYLSKE